MTENARSFAAHSIKGRRGYLLREVQPGVRRWTRVEDQPSEPRESRAAGLIHVPDRTSLARAALNRQQHDWVARGEMSELGNAHRAVMQHELLRHGADRRSLVAFSTALADLDALGDPELPPAEAIRLARLHRAAQAAAFARSGRDTAQVRAIVAPEAWDDPLVRASSRSTSSVPGLLEAVYDGRLPPPHVYGFTALPGLIGMGHDLSTHPAARNESEEAPMYYGPDGTPGGAPALSAAHPAHPNRRVTVMMPELPEQAIEMVRPRARERAAKRLNRHAGRTLIRALQLNAEAEHEHERR